MAAVEDAEFLERTEPHRGDDYQSSRIVRLLVTLRSSYGKLAELGYRIASMVIPLFLYLSADSRGLKVDQSLEHHKYLSSYCHPAFFLLTSMQIDPWYSFLSQDEQDVQRQIDVFPYIDQDSVGGHSLTTDPTALTNDSGPHSAGQEPADMTPSESELLPCTSGTTARGQGHLPTFCFPSPYTDLAPHNDDVNTSNGIPCHLGGPMVFSPGSIASHSPNRLLTRDEVDSDFINCGINPTMTVGTSSTAMSDGIGHIDAESSLLGDSDSHPCYSPSPNFGGDIHGQNTGLFQCVQPELNTDFSCLHVAVSNVNQTSSAIPTDESSGQHITSVPASLGLREDPGSRMSMDLCPSPASPPEVTASAEAPISRQCNHSKGLTSTTGSSSPSRGRKRKSPDGQSTTNKPHACDFFGCTYSM
ncbi:hypothetical protein NLI96_g12094 [Meripilus lineatus]|uniref:Uncharacterized protein n=1 Tax=Meripilus lineatus TaxID=2056292 RepID=A0AAD5YA74_9APHY|nr:hypothetical protein NLI96_g12094 [Physisporinus lineatus]